MHLTLGIYPDGSYKYNVVKDNDLESHINYNKQFRPGRLLYVDGKRVYDGCIKNKIMIKKYDCIAKKFFENNIDMDRPTIPYR